MPTGLEVLYRLAGPRAGYFTTAQASESDVSRQQLSYYARTGSIDRVAYGIYRLCQFPGQRFEDVIVACLWAGRDAVASHATALAVYELTDAMPATIQITVPCIFRGRRAGVVVHAARTEPRERTERAGVPVTTVGRTIFDVLQHLGSEDAIAAAEHALARGLVTRRSLRATLTQHGETAPPLLKLTAPTS